VADQVGVETTSETPEASYAPRFGDSYERLSCLAGMAINRLDIGQAEQAFHYLTRQFHAAKVTGERVLILQAMYHASGYENRLLLMDQKRQCDALFDEHIPVALATPRLLFYRYCPSPLDKTIRRDAKGRAWLKTQKTWMTDLMQSPAGTWEGQPLETVFLRLRYLYRTGCEHLANDPTEAAHYRARLSNSFFDSLLKFQKVSRPDVRTLVAAYQALRDFRYDVKAHEPRYRTLLTKITALQATLPRTSHPWLQLEELRQDYQSNLIDRPFNLIVV